MRPEGVVNYVVGEGREGKGGGVRLGEIAHERQTVRNDSYLFFV
jgi:hypothetical protein